MFTKSVQIFRILGFSIRVDLSWLIIAALVTWTLGGAGGLFRTYYPGLTEATYWWMAVAGMLGLFASIVLHELGHAVIARRQEMPIRGITLFIFGGVAEMTREPPTAKSEFLVAIAGPIVSVIVAGACFGLVQAGVPFGWPRPVLAVLGWLGLINVVVVLFNMIPAFPLDGGRVLRSILWHFKGNIRWATRITTTLGSWFGLFLVLLGIVQVIQGFFLGGFWMFLIGLFLRGAATASYQQMLLRRELEGEPVSRFMTEDVKTVPPDATLQQLVDDYIYRYHHKMFPVARNGTLTGCVTTRLLREVPREDWGRVTVQEIAGECAPDNTVAPDADAMEALSRMQRNSASRLMVVEDGRLRGILSLKDIMNFMAVKLDLDEG